MVVVVVVVVDKVVVVVLPNVVVEDEDVELLFKVTTEYHAIEDGSVPHVNPKQSK
jgi:hypothetical protein